MKTGGPRGVRKEMHRIWEWRHHPDLTCESRGLAFLFYSSTPGSRTFQNAVALSKCWLEAVVYITHPKAAKKFSLAGLESMFL